MLQKSQIKIHIIGCPGPPISPKRQAELLFELCKKEKKITHISPKLFLLITYALIPLSIVSKKIRDLREFLKIAYYYATESMLFWDEKIGSYSSNKTPEYGNESLEEYYKKILKNDVAYKELKDQKLFQIKKILIILLATLTTLLWVRALLVLQQHTDQRKKTI